MRMQNKKRDVRKKPRKKLNHPPETLSLFLYSIVCDLGFGLEFLKQYLWFFEYSLPVRGGLSPLAFLF